MGKEKTFRYNMGVILLYTHTDMKDVWPVFFGQIQKYMPNYEIFVCINEHTKSIDERYKQLIYDESKKYTERLKDCLDQLSEDMFIFLHEDMILLSEPNFIYLQECISYIEKNEARSIKLIAIDSAEPAYQYDSRLIENIFSIQPTIIKKESFINLLSEYECLNIWDFEKSITRKSKDYMFKLGTEKKRGIFHYDSIIFPYVATAITKGKWNYSEYENELDLLFKEYKINPMQRGLQ